MKGSLLDEVCLNHKGKPYLPLSFNKSPEPRKNPANAVQQLPMKMFNCAGIGLRTAFSSPALWTQTHFKLIGSNNSESSRRNENEGVFDDYCYGAGGGSGLAPDARGPTSIAGDNNGKDLEKEN